VMGLNAEKKFTTDKKIGYSLIHTDVNARTCNINKNNKIRETAEIDENKKRLWLIIPAPWYGGPVFIYS